MGCRYHAPYRVRRRREPQRAGAKKRTGVDLKVQPPTTARELKKLIARGEGPTLEFKRSTAELREAMQTACAFLNGVGGLVCIGVRPDATLAGQEVSDKT